MNKTIDAGYSKKKLGTLFFLIGFVLILTDSKISTTMFAYNFPVLLRDLFLWSGRGILVFKFILFDSEYSIRDFFLSFCVLILFSICCIKSGYTAIIDIGLLIVAAKGVNFDKVLNTYIVVTILTIIITILAMKLGIIENVISNRTGSMKLRNSFGFIYATDFASTLFWLVLATIYRFRYEYHYWHSILGLIVAYITYRFSDARLSTGLLLLALLFEWMASRKTIINSEKFKLILGKFAIWIMPLSAALSIIVTVFYTPSSLIMSTLNTLFTSRLELQHSGFLEYGFKIFGQPVNMIGMSGTYVHSIINNYFYIDNAYVQMMMRYGIVFMVIIIYLFIKSTRKAITNHDILFLFIMIIISFSGLIEQHLFQIAFNPFLLKVFSEYRARKNI